MTNSYANLACLGAKKLRKKGNASSDGRVYGKMVHSERCDNAVAKNIYGEEDMKIFESGVKFFQ